MAKSGHKICKNSRKKGNKYKKRKTSMLCLELKDKCVFLGQKRSQFPRELKDKRVLLGTKKFHSQAKQKINVCFLAQKSLIPKGIET